MPVMSVTNSFPMSSTANAPLTDPPASEVQVSPDVSSLLSPPFRPITPDPRRGPSQRLSAILADNGTVGGTQSSPLTMPPFMANDIIPTNRSGPTALFSSAQTVGHDDELNAASSLSSRPAARGRRGDVADLGETSPQSLQKTVTQPNSSITIDVPPINSVIQPNNQLPAPLMQQPSAPVVARVAAGANVAGGGSSTFSGSDNASDTDDKEIDGNSFISSNLGIHALMVHSSTGILAGHQSVSAVGFNTLLQRDILGDDSGAGSEPASLNGSPRTQRQARRASKLRRSSEMTMSELIAHVRDEQPSGGNSISPLRPYPPPFASISNSTHHAALSFTSPEREVSSLNGNALSTSPAPAQYSPSLTSPSGLHASGAGNGSFGMTGTSSSSPSMSGSPRLFSSLLSPVGSGSYPTIFRNSPPQVGTSSPLNFGRTRSVPGLRLASLESLRAASSSNDSLSTMAMDTIVETSETGSAKSRSSRARGGEDGTTTSMGPLVPLESRPKAARSRTRSVELAPIPIVSLFTAERRGR